MVIGSGLRGALAALAGVGAVAAAVLNVLPVLIPMEAPQATRSEPGAPPPASRPGPEPGLGFDTVRLAPDGSGLVAGRAGPGATVQVLVGDEVAAEVAADAEGRFVAFLELAPSAVPRALSLRDGSGAVSEETVILSPTVEAPSPATKTAAADDALTLGGAAGEAVAALGPPPSAPPSGEAVPEAAPGDLSANGAEPATAPEPADGSPEAVAEVPASPGPALDQTGPSLGAAEVSTLPAEEAEAPSAKPDTAGSPLSGPPSGPPPSLADASPTLAPPESEAPGQPAVLVADAEGVRVLQPALAPGSDAEVLATVALDAIAYEGGGAVTVSGRANGGVVRLYLDNLPVAEVPVGPEGQWTAVLAEAAPGIYTLRIDQVDAVGTVLSRIETPFQREARGDLAAAMAEAQEAGQRIVMRTVQPGNTLWAIARDRYGEPMMYVQVFEMNRDRIRDPDLIYPGQVFVLPATKGR